MFIVHNAIRNLWRNKGRSVLISSGQKPDMGSFGKAT